MVSDTPLDPVAALAQARSCLVGKDQSLWKRFCDQFHLRPTQDNEPQDWWFASTAIPLIAAAMAPFANVMSIVALAMPWRTTIYYDKIGTNGLPVQVPYDDPTW